MVDKTDKTSGLARILSQQGFDPANFVKKQAQGGEDELKHMRQEVSQLAENTAQALKRNVYKNYSTFIETAKEISILEGEMYQLSHMLTDQKSVMNSMQEMSITGYNVDGAEDGVEEAGEDDAQNSHLAFLLERVEGCSSVTEVRGRHLVHDGDLIEIDPESFTTLQKVHAFLLNDSLMLTTWLPQRRGTVKYRLQSLYELDSLVVVNAKDMAGVKNAFKILMFPESRMFQAETPKAKRQWLDIIEDTWKKKKSLAESQRKETTTTPSGERGDSFSPINPFGLDVEGGLLEDSSPSHSLHAETELLHAEWLQEVPEDLDVAIAQRDFEGAVDLVERVNQYLESLPKGQAVREYKARIEHRVKQLTEVLKQELQVSPERSIRGGPRAARRAVTQLIRLAKSSQACDLFLKNRSGIFRYNIRQLKIEGNTTLYVRRLCEVFFTNLMETGKEFIKAFPSRFGCYSAFVVWTSSELQYFVSSFSSQVFANKTHFSTVAECVAEARRHADKLEEIGLELTFILDRLMAPDVSKLIQESGDHQMEALKHRNSTMDDQWRPKNFKITSAVAAFEQDMVDLGVEDIRKYTFDGCFSYLTETTIEFTRSYAALCHDLFLVYSIKQHHLVTNACCDIVRAQLHYVEEAMNKEALVPQHAVIVKNAEFLVLTLASAVNKHYREVTGQRCAQLDNLQGVLKKIQSASQASC